MEEFTVKNFSFTYPGESEKALSNINITINKGDFFVIFGSSGCGKTTLLKSLKPILSPNGKKEGEIFFRGTELNSLSGKEQAEKIGFISQSPDNQTVTDRAWRELSFGLENTGKDKKTVERRVCETASFFGLEKLYDKSTATLSGGQKQLLSLASVMTMRPEVIILDEPASQLDPIAEENFYSALEKINRETGATVIITEHRLEKALPLCTGCGIMENGKLIFTGSPVEAGKYLKEKESPLFSSMPVPVRVWGSIDEDLPCPLTVGEGRRFLSEYTKSKKLLLLEESPVKEKKNKAVNINEICLRYDRNSPDVLKNLSLSAYFGEILCIAGGNGSGKTTALKLISGIKKPYRGSVEVNGKTALLPQDPKALFSESTVYAELEKMIHAEKDVEESEKRLAEITRLCSLEGLLHRHPYDLSGGEQQRAALAKILLSSPDILLLDEPVKGLDAEFRESLGEILTKLKDNGKCIIIVSHDLEFCAEYSDRCGLFFDGKIVSLSETREFFGGNSYYTTAAGRMCREFDPKIITVRDAVCAIGGKTVGRSDKIKIQKLENIPVTKDKKDPKRKLRKALGAVFASVSALLLIFFSRYNTGFRTDENGLPRLEGKQLAVYGIFALCLILAAVFSAGASVYKPVKVKKEKLSKKTIFSCFLVLLMIPLTAYLGFFVFNKAKQYYITSVIIAAECMLPFFISFEGKRPDSRKTVITAGLCAVAVSGRAVLFMLPEFKPVMAVTIIAGAALGGESGFMVGAVSMLISNMLFSQGPWTPWQMLAMGITGLLSGILTRTGILSVKKLTLSVFGALSAIIVYGGIVNPCSVLMWGHENINMKLIASSYITGLPVDIIQALATAIFLWFFSEPVLTEFERIKIKYNIAL